MQSEFEKTFKQHIDALTAELSKLGKQRQVQLAEWDIEQNKADYEFYFNAGWEAAKAQAVPEGYVLVPKTNSDKGIESMAMRYRHDFHLLDADYQEGIKSQMRQLYEEAVGLGFYRHEAQESDND